MKQMGLIKPVLFIAIFAVAMIAQEWALRFALPDYDPAQQVRFLPASDTAPILGEPNRRARQIKNTGDYNVAVNFNQYGFRDSKDVSSGTAEDIYLVGDSYSFGWGVEEEQTAAAQLQKLLGKTVFNLSIPSGIDGYESLLNHARKLGADVKRAIVFITMENDLCVCAPPIAKTPMADAPTGRSMLGEIKEYMTAHSALYLSVTSWVQQTTLLKSLFIRLGLITPNLDAARGDAISDAAIVASVRRTAQLASRFEAMVVIAPARTLWWGDDETRIAASRIHKDFVDQLQAAGVDAIDLKPVFERTDKPLSLFFTYDPHWKPATHKLIAEAVADQLPEKWR